MPSEFGNYTSYEYSRVYLPVSQPPGCQHQKKFKYSSFSAVSAWENVTKVVMEKLGILLKDLLENRLMDCILGDGNISGNISAITKDTVH